MNEGLYLNLAALLKDTCMQGPGLRDALWVQGCSIGCPGCANQAYLPHEPRVLMPVERLLAHFQVRRGRIDGCSVSGGEPSEQAEAVGALLRGVRDLGLSTVVFSGRTLEQLRRDPACEEFLAFTDLLIDGPFIQGQQDLDLPWRGSRNQRLHLLSDRWRPEELSAPGPTGEIVVSATGILLHGIGTRLLIEQTSPHATILK